MSDDYCGVYNINHPIEGKAIISPYTRAVIEGEHISAIRVKVANDHTVIYLGSNSGKLYKVI